ncbi:MAG TPA: EAL domain-containing protein, partial [Beijerinckiaceae bacterium]
ALGAWVLRRACAQARDWPDHLYVSVNISARQFEMRDVAADVRAALAAAGLPPRRLALEITETLLLERSPRVIAALEALRADGVSVKLDDFGAGYSSLAYLRQFRFDAVKIDRFFIAEIETRDENAAIVRAIADLTRALDVKLIAEGVETEAQRAKLVAAGCEFAQGFLFSRPAAVADLPAAFRTPGERAA